MELRQLTTFRTVATLLNFTRAAAALGYTQSSVTAQIQALEADLSVVLFERRGRRVTLTDAGYRLLRYSERLLMLADEARLAVSGSGEPLGSLTVSAPGTLCAYRLPAVLQHFRQCYPQVRVLLRPCPVAELRHRVSDGVLDVAFVLDPPIKAQGLCVEPLINEPVLLVAAPDHRLVGAIAVQASDLCDEAVVLTELGCSYRNLFETALLRSGVYPTATLEFGSVEAIKQCVIAGMGISVLPEVAVRNELAQGQLAALPWAGESFDVVTQMIWHRDTWMSPALKAFLDVAREHLTVSG